MNNSKKENLRELLASFMDTEAANKAAADIELGDELLRNWPAPKPSEALLAEVKQRMTAAARRHRMVTFQHRVLEMAAVAATILVLSAVALKIFENQQSSQSPAKLAVAIPDSAWEGGDISTSDADIAALSKEIDAVADEISGVRLSDKNGSSTAAVGDVEMQIIEVSADFWKG
jgi:hypothetical protein